MMKVFLIVIAGLLMVSCGNWKTGDSSYNYNPPPVKKCKMRCDERMAQCNHMCTNTFPKCQAKGKKVAAMTYARYVNQQQIAGKPINRDLNSYYDPLQCTKTTCNCQADIRACYRVCSA